MSKASDPASAPRPRGRPRVEEPGTTVTAWVRTKEYDRLVKMASTREQSLSSLVRDLLTLSKREVKR